MNNVSVKYKLLKYFFIGIIIFPIILITVLIQKYNYSLFLISIMPVWLLFFLGNIFFHLKNADIIVDKTIMLLIIVTLFNKIFIPIKELNIISHNALPRRLAFIFYTDESKIIINYTYKNYDSIIELLDIIKYKNINQFVQDAKKRISIIALA